MLLGLCRNHVTTETTAQLCEHIKPLTMTGCMKRTACEFCVSGGTEEEVN